MDGLMNAPNLQLNNFKAVKAMTTKFRDLSLNVSGNILKLI